MLRATARLNDFASDPVGRALVGEGWLHACVHPELWCVVLWGRPGAHEVEALVRSLKVELGPDIAPHASVVDLEPLEFADAGAFEALSAYVRDHTEALSRAVTRLALVRPSGLAGAITAGFFEVLPRPYPTEVVTTVPEACAWLGVAPEVLLEVRSLVRRVRERAPVVVRLRAWLGAHLRDADLDGAARALGVSRRTLQRRLKDEGTSFAAEQRSVRLDSARDRMLATDASLLAIALECGFSSQQHFSSAFRREHGEPPSAWRRRQS